MLNYISPPYRHFLANLFIWLFFFVTACSPFKKSLNNLDVNPVFKDNFTGFVLFDPENHEILFDHQGDKYYTPASNTKLFTFYVANKILGDSIPAFSYQQKGDSVWLWGTGDPSFLNPDLPGSKVFGFLKDKNIVLVRDRNVEPIYGPGWAWDDYSGSYQREKTSFPIYANALRVSWDSLKQDAEVSPKLFIDQVNFEAPQTARQPNTNEFMVDNTWNHEEYIEIPFKTSDSLLSALWGDTLNSKIIWQDFQEPLETKTFKSIPSDSVFSRMLQVSDNFLAEQLILLSSWKLLGELNSTRTIELLVDSLLSDLPQPPIWVDGSGLSRYNLFTPHTMVALLHKIHQEVSKERIFNLFPAGGQSGTIENYYAADSPYIFAKTGTLRNNHALSGFLVARSGKILIFSFMHNHYTTSSHPIKLEMEKLLWQIHLKY